MPRFMLVMAGRRRPSHARPGGARGAGGAAAAAPVWRGARESGRGGGVRAALRVRRRLRTDLGETQNTKRENLIICRLVLCKFETAGRACGRLDSESVFLSAFSNPRVTQQTFAPIAEDHVEPGEGMIKEPCVLKFRPPDSRLPQKLV